MTATQTPPPVVKHTGRNGNGAASPAGPGGPAEDGQPLPARRNSIYPLMLDFGLVLAAFGLIIVRPVFSPSAGNVAIVVGAVFAVIALAGWIREVRGEYLRLQD